jgi:hypothetical protein
MDQSPGMMSAIVNALRGASGMSAPPPQQSPQQPDLMTAYRQYVLATQEQGGTPMPMQQWAASQRGQ